MAESLVPGLHTGACTTMQAESSSPTLPFVCLISIMGDSPVNSLQLLISYQRLH